MERRSDLAIDQLGLDFQAVRLVDHQERWSNDFEQEVASIRSRVAMDVLALEHIGSTSVPGLRAKPVIDLLGGVASFERVPALVGPLTAVGYDYLGSGIVQGHHVFAKGRRRTHLLHVVEHGRRRWRELLAFRDLLRRDARVRLDYQRLKEELARRYAHDRATYATEKSPFVDPLVAAELRDAVR